MRSRNGAPRGILDSATFRVNMLLSAAFQWVCEFSKAVDDAAPLRGGWVTR